MSFVHLHVHSQYSILDGAASISGLVSKAVEFNMPALALTDHGYMYGIKTFHDVCTKQNIKPLLGVEAYVAKSGIEQKRGKEDYGGYHLVMIAKNMNGYKSLLKLNTIAATDGFYQRPRIDRKLLEQYGEDLIISSACLGGEIPQKILANDFEAAEEAILWHKNLFGDDFYLEMMKHFSKKPELNNKTYNEQLIVNKYLIEAAQRHNIKLIATNDIHFINAEDADAHDLLICLTTNSKLDDPKRMRYTGEEYFKSYEEMYELFGDVPQALSNTLEIADKVENFKLKSPAIMPFFEIPKEYASLEEYETKFDENSLITEFGKERYEGINGTYQDKLKIKLESDYLLHLTIKGAEERYPTPLSKEVLDRINFEIDTIKTMGFPGYFLIVQDFVRFARENGVLVGPGRGSAAGSIVSYCTGITDIDPLEFGLLFERFLNPDRISMPDVDIDFDDDGRQLVLNYVTEKYGQKNVAQIVTFGTMAAKSAIRDVARVLEVPLDEAMQLTKLLPEQNASLSNAYNLIMEGEKEHGSIEKYIAEINKEITHNITIGNDKPVPKLETRRVLAQEIIQARKIKNDKIIKTIQFACILEGSVRQTGVHACGVLIGRDGLINNIPLMPSKESKLLSTQYDGSLVESIGLLKMDFLGLKTLSIIKEALQNIKYGHNIDINLKEISFEDPKVYSLFSKGETTGLFQFESEGMKSHLKNLKPTEFGDLVAMNALYRPGPMEYIPDFIKRKNGFAEVSYDHPIMEEYLKPTYGITVYQEQVMLLSRALANFTRGESDSLRKAMGKKVISEMENLKSRFISGCNSNPKFIEGCNQINKNPDDVIEKIWKDWEAFANYAFNKSHSVCYAHLAYQTAYLKAYYPAEFMAACLSRNLSDIKEISKLMSECKRMKLKVLGPDVNASVAKFGVDSKGNIRFGLSAIKNVGSNAVRDIIEERQENGNYTDIFNFVERVNLSSVNKKNLEALAYSGALDEFEDIHRHQYFLSAQHENTSLIENLINYGNLMQSSSLSSHNLFGELLSVEAKKPDIPDPIPIVDTVWLNHEKTHIGLYISAHPLDEYAFELKYLKHVPLEILKKADISLLGSEFLIAGYITSSQTKITKKGKEFGQITLEDYTDSYTLNLFGNDFRDFKNYLQSEQCVLISIKFQPRYNNPEEFEAKVQKIEWLNILKEGYFRNIELAVDINNIDQEFVKDLEKIVKTNKGKVSLFLRLEDFEKQLSVKTISRSFSVDLNEDMIEYLETNNYFTDIKLY